MKNNDTKVKHRNRLHDHPLMKKGGVHQKSNKALRRAARQALQRKWDEQKALLTVVCAYPTCRGCIMPAADHDSNNSGNVNYYVSLSGV